MLQRIQSVLSSSGESQPVNFNRGKISCISFFYFMFYFFLWNVEKIRKYCIFFIIYPFVLKTLFRLVKI